ncbi:hypothetical protein GGF32_003172 [Allomyces javanicus]|nr:hypothetical protein GGF32_003172 [Allomyces javanicus]
MADPITPTPPTQFADGGYARVPVPVVPSMMPVADPLLPVPPATATGSGLLQAVGPPPLDRTPSKASSLEEGEIRDAAPGSAPAVRPAGPSPAGLPTTTTRSLASSPPLAAAAVPIAYAVPPPPPPAGIRATAPAFTPPSGAITHPDHAPRLHHDPWARADDHHHVRGAPSGTPRSPGRIAHAKLMKPHAEMMASAAAAGQWAAHEHRASFEAPVHRRPAPAPHEDFARQQQQQQQQQARRPQAPQDVAAMAQRAAWNQSQQQPMYHEMSGRGARGSVSGEHGGFPIDMHAQQQAAWYAAHGVPVPGHAHHHQHPDASAMWGAAGYPAYPTAGAHGVDPRQQIAHAQHQQQQQQKQQQHMHSFAAQQQHPQHAIPVPEAMYHAHQTAAAVAGASAVPAQDAHSAAEMQVATLALALQKAMARVHELQRENKDLKGSQSAIVSLQQQMAQLQLSIANTPPASETGSRNAAGSPTVGAGMARGDTRKSPPQTPRSAAGGGREQEAPPRQQPTRKDSADQETGGAGGGGVGGRARRSRRQSDKDQDTAGWHDRRRSDKDQDASSGWHDRRRSDTTGDRVARPPSSISTCGPRGGGKQGDTSAPHSRAAPAGRASGKGSPTGASPTEDRALGGRSRAKSGGKPAKQQPGERKGRGWGEPDEKAMAEAAKWMALETSSASSTTTGTGGGKRTPPRSGDKAKDTTPPKNKKTGKGDVTSRLGPRVVADSAADMSSGKPTESGPAPAETKANKSSADALSTEIKADKGAADVSSTAKTMVHADSGHAPEPPLAAAVTTTAEH